MKAIIFDMDGLMVDSERLYQQAQEEITRQFNNRKGARQNKIVRVHKIGARQSKIVRKFKSGCGETKQ